MERESLRRIIFTKLEQGVLPYDSIPRVWGGQGNGEICDACDLSIEKTEFVMEGISIGDDNDGHRPLTPRVHNGDDATMPSDRRRPLQLHVQCFQIWDMERRARKSSNGPALRQGATLAAAPPIARQ
jgi:hypothetical protein